MCMRSIFQKKTQKDENDELVDRYAKERANWRSIPIMKNKAKRIFFRGKENTKKTRRILYLGF